MRTIKTLKDITIKELIDVTMLPSLSTVDDFAEAARMLYGDEVEELPITDWLEAVNDVMGVIGKAPTVKKIDRFKFEGVEYRAKSVDELTAKEFIDFETLSKEKPIDHITTLLAIAFTDGKEEGNYVERITERATRFENLDAQTAQEALNFTFTVWQTFAKRMLDSSPQAVRDTKEFKEMLKVLKDGAGS